MKQRDGVDRLVDRWLTEPGFKDRMRNDPEGTVRAAGIELDEQEWATVRSVVYALSDEALRERVSKSSLN